MLLCILERILFTFEKRSDGNRYQELEVVYNECSDESDDDDVNTNEEEPLRSSRISSHLSIRI